MSHVARVIKTKREKAKVSQAELAEALGYGSGQFISNIERGLAALPPTAITNTCNMLNIKNMVLIDAMTKDYREKLISHAIF